jgi:hypothetical protein
MSNDLKQRLTALDPILETHYDTQRSVEQDPYGATQAIEQALYLLRDQARYIELFDEMSNAQINLWAYEATAKQVALGRIEELKAKLAKTVEALHNLIQHTHNCEKELTEKLHHQDFCGESLPLTNARTTLAELGKQSHE